MDSKRLGQLFYSTRAEVVSLPETLAARDAVSRPVVEVSCARLGLSVRALFQNFRFVLIGRLEKHFVLVSLTLNSMKIVPWMASLNIFRKVLHRKMVDFNEGRTCCSFSGCPRVYRTLHDVFHLGPYTKHLFFSFFLVLPLLLVS